MKVKIYTTRACPKCFELKNFLKSKNVDFEDIDVGVDINMANEMIEKSDQLTIPVVDIDGKIIIGLDEKAIEEALK